MAFRVRLFVFGIFVILRYLVSGDEFNPCGKNDHYTDPRFTCCASKRYDAPKMYSKENMDNCLNQYSKVKDKKSDGKDTENKDTIVQSAWTVYKCLVDKALGGKEMNLDNFQSVMAEKLPENVTKSINELLQMNFTQGIYSPYKDVKKLKEFEIYANAWNAYYSAEHLACVIHGSNFWQMSSIEGRCFDWEERTSRRGACCDQTPIPLQLYSEPLLMESSELRNYTAVNLMTIGGEDYNYQNATVVKNSKKVSMCSKIAKLIISGELTLDEFKKAINNSWSPDYKRINEMVVPKFIPKPKREEILKQIKIGVDSDTVVEMTSRGTFNKFPTVYNYTKADEWKSNNLNDNATRFLIWHCQVHSLMIRNYKQLDLSKMC